ncbi:Prophage CP4-57 regulatory protein (AlpA) [Acinetobacter venetianus]|uniref:Prophage CP4-57 regulatory protein (AlpA) n=1 Tax=Acinetobacter venetianus TaxID=52133 RepID=A0A150HLR6_9GAMM|nr:AlpA family phage regulatory protein [Acinetobacter venetianus]KXZ66440.1 Prophage CP4-57 regulatory protein (AlpA) [Acinetobacter venetianus]
MEKLDSEIVVGGGVIENLNDKVFITMKDLGQMLSMSRSQIDRLSKIEPNFPQKIRFGKSQQSMIRYHSDDVMTYIQSKRVSCTNDFHLQEGVIQPS